MNDVIFDRTNELPQAFGVFNLIDAGKQSLYVGAAENIKREVERLFAQNDFLENQTVKIEAFQIAENDLIKIYGETIRRRKPLYNFSLAEQNLYPHFKITRETFPRVLVTRRIADDRAEYFGAFLPETGVRFMLGIINRMFKTRGCTIPIDGSFIVPCTEFYRKKCVAPCVENLCNRESYLETVNFARLFLQNNQTELDRIVAEKIERAAEALNFERAAEWRDFLTTVKNFLGDKERNYSLSDATDTYEIKQTGGKILISLVTQRKRKNLGRRVFAFENRMNLPAQEILAQTLWQFYAFHTPKEIVVPFDFPARIFLEKILRARGAGDKFKINVLKKNNTKVTVERALKRTAFEFEQENLKPQKTLVEIQAQLRSEFDLRKTPHRIEAFDVAHISGTDFVCAKSVWAGGKFLTEEYEFWFSDARNELAVLARAVAERFQSKEIAPDLILIDGGKSQLKAALEVLRGRKIPIVSAVKPPQKHNEISHFLFADGAQKAFDKNSDAAQILLKLRDEAHALANYVHRTKRETAHFYEASFLLPDLTESERKSLLLNFSSLAKLKNATESELVEFLGLVKGRKIFNRLKEPNVNFEPFIVQIRFDDPNGAAADLGRPLDLPEKIYRKMREDDFGGGGRNRTDE